MAVSDDSPCACGRTLPLLASLEGRSDDSIQLEDGRTLHALQLMRRLRVASGEDRLQVVQEATHVFRVRIINDSLRDRDLAASRLVAELHELVGQHSDVTIEWVDVLPAEANGKTRMVISKVAQVQAPVTGSSERA